MAPKKKSTAADNKKKAESAKQAAAKVEAPKVTQAPVQPVQ